MFFFINSILTYVQYLHNRLQYFKFLKYIKHDTFIYYSNNVLVILRNINHLFKLISYIRLVMFYDTVDTCY